MRFRWANAADAASVVLFAAVGRASHAEGVTPVGVLEVAWPFLVGAVLGSLAARTWRHPDDWATGVTVWTGTLVVGMLLRAWTGGGVQLSFVVVAGVVLAVLLVGWRLVYRLARRRRPTLLVGDSSG